MDVLQRHVFIRPLRPLSVFIEFSLLALFLLLMFRLEMGRRTDYVDPTPLFY